MTRYFCDYCDTYLTHDSEAGRQQHNRGWRHRESFKKWHLAKMQQMQQMQQMNSQREMEMMMTQHQMMMHQAPAPLPYLPQQGSPR